MDCDMVYDNAPGIRAKMIRGLKTGLKRYKYTERWELPLHLVFYVLEIQRLKSLPYNKI